ncbi:MAG: hypothetical protein GXO77_07620 [Calditrichaeota bacterium]|nr:hypothetical protein [Calditrichota bacterium]
MSKTTKWLLAVAGVLIIIFSLQFNLQADDEKEEKHPEVDFTQSCMECHKEVTPDIVRDWEKSKHGVMNFGCYMCHGDGQVEFYRKPSTETCLSCHTGEPVDARKGGNLQCFSCHNGHSLKFHQ